MVLSLCWVMYFCYNIMYLKVFCFYIYMSRIYMCLVSVMSYLIQSTSKDRPAKYLYLNTYVSLSVESMMEYWIDKLTISP